MHYDYVEWLLYKTKSLSEEKLNEMEEHLYTCDQCMETFLSLIEDAEIDLASKLVAENFTASVIQAISKEKVKPINKKDRKIEESKADKRASKYDKNTFNYQLIYYVAVASITIFLSLGGFYTSLVDAVPRIRESIEMVDVRPNSIGRLSERIVNSTSELISSIENIDRFEEESDER